MTYYLRMKGYATDTERQQAMWLVEAIKTIQNEEQNASREMANEGLQEIIKLYLR